MGQSKYFESTFQNSINSVDNFETHLERKKGGITFTLCEVNGEELTTIIEKTWSWLDFIGVAGYNLPKIEESKTILNSDYPVVGSKHPECNFEKNIERIQAVLKKDGDGLSLSLYEVGENGIYLLDETWWTWKEFIGVKSFNLTKRKHGVIKLDANFPTTEEVVNGLAEKALESLSMADLEQTESLIRSIKNETE